MATILNRRLANLRALVVDDMAAMRQNIRSQLGDLGIPSVDQAGTPNEVIAYVRKHSYDVIICDYNLNKETNGQQLLEFLRSQNLLSAATMFIMVTAESSYDLVASAAEFQPDAYMLKPLTGGKLLERIERLLDRQEALRPIVDRLGARDLSGAIEECDRIAKAQPKLVLDVLKIKGNALLELDRANEAQAVYAEALALRDDLVWAQLGIARCHLVSGRLKEAKTCTRELLERNDKYVAAYDLLARVAEAQGNEREALEALSRSYEVVPSARRSRMVGDMAYRTGDLEQARTSFERALSHTKGSLTAQPSDTLALAQIHVDIGDARSALQVLATVPKQYAESDGFGVAQAALQAQAHAKLGEQEAAELAYARARSQEDITDVANITNITNAMDVTRADARANTAALTLARAAFALGRNDEGAAILSKAVQADHENRRMVSLARKVLKDSGKEDMTAEIIDEALKRVTAIVNEARALMRGTQFDQSLAKVEEALQRMPENTGVLMAAAQLHLLWMSQKGLNRDYVAKVNAYLSKLDMLLPGDERVPKMYRFMRETLSRTAA